MPTCSPAGVAAPHRGRPRRPARRRAASSSSTVLTIGNIRLTGVSWATRTTASSWSASSPGTREREPEPAQPQERVGLGRHRQVGQRLVAADVEGAQRDPAAAHRLGDRAVDRLLLVHLRRAVAAEEQELGAHQAGQVGAGRRRGPGVLDRADVGPHEHVVTVRGPGRRAGPAGARPPRPTARRPGRAAARGPRRPGRPAARRCCRRGRPACRPAMSSTPVPAPTTAGMPRARTGSRCARSGCPRRAPPRRRGPGRARRPAPGVRSAATSTPCPAARSGAATPSSCRRTSSPTARTSAARARR